MKQIRKNRFVTLLVTFSLAVTMFSMVADAAEIDQSTLKRIENYLTMLMKDSEGYGLSGLDLESLQCGEEINIYESVNDSVRRIDSSFYPIYSEGELCTGVLVTVDDVQIAKNIADELIATGNNEGYISLIFDNKHLWVWNGNQLSVLHSFSPVDGRESLSDVPTDVILCPVRACMELSINGVAEKRATFNPYLNVGRYTQEAGSKYCWACACVSIGNFRGGPIMTAITFAQTYGSSDYFYCSKQIGEAIPKLNQHYSLSYTYGGVLSIDKIKSYLQNGYPIYASNSVNGSSTNHHAVVIRGVDTTNGYISVMDPEVGSSYVSASMAWVNGDLTYKYTSPASQTTQVVVYCGYPS